MGNQAAPALKRAARVMACFASLLLATLSHAATLPAGFSETRIATGLTMPTSLATAPDGRIFVTEQTGRLRVIRDGMLLAQPFVTLSVNTLGERGLLGVALDPDFTNNGYVYLYYTSRPRHHASIASYAIRPAPAIPMSPIQPALFS
jgi:glucose/arabinose dehydrogenase